MRKVGYMVDTPKGSVEVKTLTRANEIITEKGGTCRTAPNRILKAILQLNVILLFYL